MVTLAKHALVTRSTQQNSLLIILMVGLTLFLLFAMPVLLNASSWWGLLLLAAPWVFLVQWALIHEAIHKLLLPETRENEIAGRVLSIGMGASFHVLRFGHLMHHKLNRHWQSEYVDRLNWKAKAGYYWNLMAGLYFTEVFASFMLAVVPNKHIPHVAQRYFFADRPEVADAGARFFITKGNIRFLRQDVAAIIALYVAAFFVYGTAWPWFVAIIIARAFVISFMDNFYHYATPEDNSRAGKEAALPDWLSKMLLNSNYHETHHLHPDVPWHHLPEYSHDTPKPGFLEAAMLQFRGPILRVS